MSGNALRCCAGLVIVGHPVSDVVDITFYSEGVCDSLVIEG